MAALPPFSSTVPAVQHRTAPDDFRRVGVVGAGLMGSGIAEVCARVGLDVVVCETGPETAEAGRRRITASLDRGVRRHKLTAAERDTALGRIRFTTNLADMADRDAVIEAVAEDEQVKTEVFSALDNVVARPDAILASNTSAIPIMKLGMATGRPEQVIGVHFFNPVPVLNLVELVPSLLTGRQTRIRTENLLTTVLGKQVIGSQDRAGFVVNALPTMLPGCGPAPLLAPWPPGTTSPPAPCTSREAPASPSACDATPATRDARSPRSPRRAGSSQS